jgi:RHS repeat-associated protein
MSDLSGTTYYTYDARDRLTNETQVNVVSSSKITSSLLYSYDKTSNIISMTYPDGTVLTYTYDALNRVSHVGSYANFTYTLDNQIKSINYGSKVTTIYTYDSMDRPLSISATNSSTTFESFTYKYDLTGNLITINNPTYSYTYDNLNRLNSSIGPWGTVNYTYDATGNRIKMVFGSTTTTYAYNAYNRLSSAGTSGWTATYTFNHDGDLTKLVNGSNTWNYYYNFDNDLIGVSKNSANVQNSTYNAEGDRITNKLGSSTAVFLYQGSRILYQNNASSSTTTDYFFANGIQISSKIGSGSATYFLVDNLGSIRVTLSSIGDKQFSSDYEPYGVSYGVSGTPIPQLQFSGKMTDAQVAIGIYYFGSRYYDTNSGRFLSEDSNMGSLTDPMSLNRYIYGEDNPMAVVDPTGHIGGPPPHYAQPNNAQSSNPISGAISWLEGAASTVANYGSNLVQQTYTNTLSEVQTVYNYANSAVNTANNFGLQASTDIRSEAQSLWNEFNQPPPTDTTITETTTATTTASVENNHGPIFISETSTSTSDTSERTPTDTGSLPPFNCAVVDGVPASIEPDVLGFFFGAYIGGSIGAETGPEGFAYGSGVGGAIGFFGGLFLPIEIHELSGCP